MRVHPIFTQPKDWTGDGTIDGIEALVELTDQFGDPTKARGQIVFELYTFRRANPDPRGDLLKTWIMPIHTLAQQKEHWRKIGGAYAFQLPFPGISPSGEITLMEGGKKRHQGLVLSSEMTFDDGGRMRDHINLSSPR
jgi:hypothetical protein